MKNYFLVNYNFVKAPLYIYAVKGSKPLTSAKVSLFNPPKSFIIKPYSAIYLPYRIAPSNLFYYTFNYSYFLRIWNRYEFKREYNKYTKLPQFFPNFHRSYNYFRKLKVTRYKNLYFKRRSRSFLFFRSALFKRKKLVSRFFALFPKRYDKKSKRYSRFWFRFKRVFPFNYCFIRRRIFTMRRLRLPHRLFFKLKKLRKYALRYIFSKKKLILSIRSKKRSVFVSFLFKLFFRNRHKKSKKFGRKFEKFKKITFFKLFPRSRFLGSFRGRKLRFRLFNFFKFKKVGGKQVIRTLRRKFFPKFLPKIKYFFSSIGGRQFTGTRDPSFLKRAQFFSPRRKWNYGFVKRYIRHLTRFRELRPGQRIRRPFANLFFIRPPGWVARFRAVSHRFYGITRKRLGSGRYPRSPLRIIKRFRFRIFVGRRYLIRRFLAHFSVLKSRAKLFYLLRFYFGKSNKNFASKKKRSNVKVSGLSTVGKKRALRRISKRVRQSKGFFFSANSSQLNCFQLYFRHIFTFRYFFSVYSGFAPSKKRTRLLFVYFSYLRRVISFFVTVIKFKNKRLFRASSTRLNTFFKRINKINFLAIKTNKAKFFNIFYRRYFVRFFRFSLFYSFFARFFMCSKHYELFFSFKKKFIMYLYRFTRVGKSFYPFFFIYFRQIYFDLPAPSRFADRDFTDFRSLFFNYRKFERFVGKKKPSRLKLAI